MSKSSTTTKPQPDGKLPLITPGEILDEEFMKPLGISQNGLARALSIPVSRVAGIVRGDRSITADTALRLSRHFGNSAQFWMNLQQYYDLERARDERGAEIEATVRQRAV